MIKCYGFLVFKSVTAGRKKVDPLKRLHNDEDRNV